MAVLPPCSLCKPSEFINQKLEVLKKQPLILNFIFILIIEVVSNFIKFNPDYVTFYYPLLTQLGMFIFSFSFYLHRERLRFCSRKTASLFYLSIYYLFNIFSLFICLEKAIYYDIINLGLLLIVFVLFIMSFLNKIK